MLMVVGSLNREGPTFEGARGVGLSVFAFDPMDGTAVLLFEDGSIDNPTFLSINPATLCVYANTEVVGWHEGTVSAYRVDRAARRLRYLNKQPTLGSITAHSSLDRAGRHLLVANYGLGPHDDGPDQAVVVFPLRQDGGLGAPEARVAHRGRGPDAERQERAHPHCVLPSPDGRYVAVVDLGLDAILSYGFGPDGALADAPVARATLPPGCGPRHLAFCPGGRLAVAICELDSTLLSFRFDARTGAFALLDRLKTTRTDARSGNFCSDVQIHPNGRFVYGANRGQDTVVIATIDPREGTLTLVGYHPCGGRTPRNLAIDPSGHFLVVANQNSDVLTVFAIDEEDGTLSKTPGAIPVGTPMCIRFLNEKTT